MIRFVGRAWSSGRPMRSGDLGRARQLLSVFVLVGALLHAGCSGDPESKTAPGEPAVQTYVVEGILTQLPSAPARELMIRHVAIADFVSASGDTVGMDAMTMGFPVGEESILEGFAPGDSIRFVFEVRWGGARPLRLTAMEHLPPGTVLDFGKLERR